MTKDELLQLENLVVLGKINLLDSFSIIRKKTIEECAHVSELCGVDMDGHHIAEKIRALLEKKMIEPKTPEEWARWILKKRWTQAILMPMNDIQLSALYEETIGLAQEQTRKETIEECAQIALSYADRNEKGEDYISLGCVSTYHRIAGENISEEIRALLEKEK